MAFLAPLFFLGLAALAGMSFYVLSGKLSDKVGRKIAPVLRDLGLIEPDD